MPSPQVARDETQSTISFQLKTREGERMKRAARNIYRDKDGGGWRIRFEGPDPVFGNWVKRTKRLPANVPREEVERIVETANRFDAIWQIVRKHLCQDERGEKGRQWSRPLPLPLGRPASSERRGPRGLVAANWKSAPGFPGIQKSEYGWQWSWRETDRVSGERVSKAETHHTNVPPGPDEPPPDWIVRERERRRREGLAGYETDTLGRAIRPGYRRGPKSGPNLRAMHIAPPVGHRPPFAVQLKAALKEARLSVSKRTAKLLGVGYATLVRHLKGDPPTKRLVGIYEKNLEKRTGGPVKFVV